MALIRVAIYGCGQFANRTHMPNLMKFDDVEIVAICDSNVKQLESTAEAFCDDKGFPIFALGYWGCRARRR